MESERNESFQEELDEGEKQRDEVKEKMEQNNHTLLYEDTQCSVDNNLYGSNY